MASSSCCKTIGQRKLTNNEVGLGMPAHNPLLTRWERLEKVRLNKLNIGINRIQGPIYGKEKAKELARKNAIEPVRTVAQMRLNSKRRDVKEEEKKDHYVTSQTFINTVYPFYTYASKPTCGKFFDYNNQHKYLRCGLIPVQLNLWRNNYTQSKPKRKVSKVQSTSVRKENEDKQPVEEEDRKLSLTRAQSIKPPPVEPEQTKPETTENIESEPTELEPQPTVTEPEPTEMEPETTVMEPETTVMEPETTVIEPETTVIEPQPTVIEQETTVIEPQPTVIEPQPTVMEPEPTVTEPETIVTEPQPTEAQHEAKGVEAESSLTATQAKPDIAVTPPQVPEDN